MGKCSIPATVGHNYRPYPAELDDHTGGPVEEVEGEVFLMNSRRRGAPGTFWRVKTRRECGEGHMDKLTGKEQ